MKMPETMIREKVLAEAVAKLVDSLHHKYPGIKVRPISAYEDEDFTLEVSVSKELPVDEVEEACHRECLKTEDEYDVYIFPKVVYEQ